MYGNIVVIYNRPLQKLITDYKNTHKLTQQGFAKKTGLSISATKQITEKCTYKKLERICRLIGVSPKDYINVEATKQHVAKTHATPASTGDVFNPNRVVYRTCNRCHKSFRTKLHTGDRICISCNICTRGIRYTQNVSVTRGI